MKSSTAFFLGLSFLTLTSAASAEEKAKTKIETTEIKVDALTLSVPKTWEQKPPANRLRKGQFIIPKAEGDKSTAELVISSFGGGGGGVKANIDRWIGQFDSKGRKAKLTQGKSAQGPYVFVDITGTYKKPIGPPIAGKTERLPNARMLGVMLYIEKAQAMYFLKLPGETKTITAAADEFRNSFGADIKSEKDVKLGE